VSRLTLDVPAELRAILKRYPEIRWERVAENALWSYARKVKLADQIASRSALTEAAAETIGREVKAGIRRRYLKAAR
jgi:hypothetical protein